MLARLTAPLLPYLSESLYQGLTGARSVHLADWPRADELSRDDALVAQMDLVREVCSAGNSIRKSQGLRSRLPLASVTIAAAHADELGEFVELIKDELNVKAVILSEDASGLTSTKLSVIPAALGPRLGPRTQQVIKALRGEDWSVDAAGRVVVGGVELEDGEYEMRLQPVSPAAARVLESSGGVVVLDLEVSDELAAEGMARDLVREIQQARKDAGLNVADRISLELYLPGELAWIARDFGPEISAQTLAREMSVSELASVPDGLELTELSDGTTIAIALAKVVA
jgi:isoleucyl-tRNA synthetase